MSKGATKRRRAKADRRHQEYMDQLRYLVGDQADNSDLFVNETDDDLATFFRWSYSDAQWAPRSTVTVLVLVKAGIPQKEWNRERPIDPA